jgi:hypothetical protein
MPTPPGTSHYFKILACEVALREICHAVAQSPHIVDVEFVPQGLHDRPDKGVAEIQARLNAVPAGKYDAILLGYGLCGNLITGLTSTHTRLVVPRAHDCITFFLGSKERYAQLSGEKPGAYFYTSGWLECVRRRGETMVPGHPAYLPSRAGANPGAGYDQWVARYGEAKARELMEVMGELTGNYTHGVLIDFDFARPLRLQEQVQAVCQQRGWQFEQIPGDLGLLRRWVNGEWDPANFLVVEPGRQIQPSYDEGVVKAALHDAATVPTPAA